MVTANSNNNDDSNNGTDNNGDSNSNDTTTMTGSRNCGNVNINTVLEASIDTTLTPLPLLRHQSTGCSKKQEAQVGNVGDGMGVVLD